MCWPKRRRRRRERQGTPEYSPSALAYGYPYPYPTLSQAVEWIPSNPQHAHALSGRAVVAGYEAHDGSPLWVIRATFQGDLIPGKLAVMHQVAYVSWDGKENDVHNFEVCCARPERIRWIASRDGDIPPNAVVAGRISSGERLYVGRAMEQGYLTPGKVHPSHGKMYMPFAGKELRHSTYEVLCTV